MKWYVQVTTPLPAGMTRTTMWYAYGTQQEVQARVEEAFPDATSIRIRPPFVCSKEESTSC